MKEEFIKQWKSQVKKGSLSFVILKALHEKRLYGYELIEHIKLKSNIGIAEGTLYPLMNRLKNAELALPEWVEQESGIPRKYYQITQEGKETLGLMHEYWADLELSIKKI